MATTLRPVDRQRDTRVVLEDHLAKRDGDDLEGDLRDNYSRDVVGISLTGIRRGWDGIREQARELEDLMPDGNFRYQELVVADEYGMLVWDGDSPGGTVREGCDSFVVRDGRIVAQTVHYHVSRSERG